MVARERASLVNTSIERFLGTYGNTGCSGCLPSRREGRDGGADAVRVAGNVRELRNILERATLFSKTEVLDRSGSRFDRTLVSDVRREEELILDDADRLHILLVLGKVDGRADDTAKLLKLSRSSLYARAREVRNQELAT